MSERIITLFGEEIIPEQVKAAGKSRAKKKQQEQETATTSEAQPENKKSKKNKAEQEPEKEQSRTEVEEEAHPVSINAGKKATTEKKEEHTNLPDDWEGDKQYYSIGEVAALFKVKTSHIRFWTNEFKLKVRTTRKGDRLYTAEQIKELRAIHHLVKERGFTLSGAKAKLKAQNKMDVETIDLKQSLLQLRNKLLIIRNQLA